MTESRARDPAGVGLSLPRRTMTWRYRANYK